MSKPIPLNQLEGELRSIVVHVTGGDKRIEALWFYWNGEHHMVPFDDHGDNKEWGMNVWKRISGTTIDDITLAPSYFCKSPPTHVLHCFIRNGAVHPC